MGDGYADIIAESKRPRAGHDQGPPGGQQRDGKCGAECEANEAQRQCRRQSQPPPPGARPFGGPPIGGRPSCEHAAVECGRPAGHRVQAWQVTGCPNSSTGQGRRRHRTARRQSRSPGTWTRSGSAGLHGDSRTSPEQAGGSPPRRSKAAQTAASSSEADRRRPELAGARQSAGASSRGECHEDRERRQGGRHEGSGRGGGHAGSRR